jgi:carotenoid 1,2-hydratase
MDISFFSKNNDKILANEHNAYEWWYADFMDVKTGLSGVIIFYNGNLFSPAYIHAQKIGDQNYPENFPAVSLSLYKDKKPYYYSFLEFDKKDVSYKETSKGLSYTLGKNSFEYLTNDRSLLVSINQTLASTDSIDLSLVFKSALESRAEGLSTPNVQTNSAHTWKCIIPNAEVEGEIKVNDVKYTLNQVKGYHDHNAGLEPLHHFFDDWYWGRIHLAGTKETVIFYSFVVNKKMQTNGWVINSDGDFSSIQSAEYNDYKRNLFGLRRATKIKLSSRFEICFDSIVDKGPFYERYICSLKDLENPANDGLGFAEYIYPKNIYKSWVHRLVNLRLRYMYKKAHTILSSKRLYKFTWKLL